MNSKRWNINSKLNYLGTIFFVADVKSLQYLKSDRVSSTKMFRPLVLPINQMPIKYRQPRVPSLFAPASIPYKLIRRWFTVLEWPKCYNDHLSYIVREEQLFSVKKGDRRTRHFVENVECSECSRYFSYETRFCSYMWRTYMVRNSETNSYARVVSCTQFKNPLLMLMQQSN